MKVPTPPLQGKKEDCVCARLRERERERERERDRGGGRQQREIGKKRVSMRGSELKMPYYTLALRVDVKIVNLFCIDLERWYQHNDTFRMARLRSHPRIQTEEFDSDV